MTQQGDPTVPEEEDEAEKPARRKKASGAVSRRSVLWTAAAFAVAAAAAITLWATDFQPARLYGAVTGPEGKIYVSSPGVYTRERLVNDRNDQDYWLRAQLETLDRAEIRHAAINRRDNAITVGGGPAPEEEAEDAAAASAQEENAGNSAASAPQLSFLNSYTVRAAARDIIRQSILENLLDDRHDLTGNSVYGLKFDTTVYPSRYSQGRAYVRIAITAGESDLVREGEQAATTPEQAEFQDLPRRIQEYYKNYHDISTNLNNFNYNSFKLYKQWLGNLSWRLNSHFTQVKESMCACKEPSCAPVPNDWTEKIGATVATVLATDTVNPVAGRIPSVSGHRLVLAEPWDNFLQILVTKDAPGCSNNSKFEVLPTEDIVYLGPKQEEQTGTTSTIAMSRGRTAAGQYFPVDTVDDEHLAYVFAASASSKIELPRYRKISLILKYANSVGKLIGCEENDEACYRPLLIPSGYFNFIEKVIRPDMYAYSLFPRMEAASVLSGRKSSVNLDYPSGDSGAARYGLRLSDRRDEARLEPLAVGFTDAKSDKSISLGWVVEVEAGGLPFQKSQFALISVPAWTSKLSVKVTTGWLGRDSEEKQDDSFTYEVPIPPDYEAFDAFIGGEEAVRRPQINTELMDPEINLVACRKASILIPGLRLWRSSMVTIGSERADRITVLPNMRGIIAEFTKLPLPTAPGPATLRVWTSEGVDTQQGKINIRPPPKLEECADRLDALPKDLSGGDQAPPAQEPEQEPQPEQAREDGAAE